MASKVMSVVDRLKPVLLGALVVIAGVLQYRGVIDISTFNLVISILGGGTAASVMMTEKRIEEKADRALNGKE